MIKSSLLALTLLSTSIDVFAATTDQDCEAAIGKATIQAYAYGFKAAQLFSVTQMAQNSTDVNSSDYYDKKIADLTEIVRQESVKKNEARAEAISVCKDAK